MEQTGGDSTVQSLMPLIQEVVKQRQNYAALHTELEMQRVAWELGQAVLMAQVKQAQSDMTVAETNLRGEALANYAATGNKQVAPGIVIRVTHKAVYDVPTATAWSLAHGGIAHTFDAKVFDKLAMANPSLTADFVSIEDVPIATLAKDLKGDA